MFKSLLGFSGGAAVFGLTMLLFILLPLFHRSDLMGLLGGFGRELDVMICMIWTDTLGFHLGPCLEGT